MNYYFEVLGKFGDFSGRARRAEFWTFTLINFMVSAILAVISVAVAIVSGSGAIAIIDFLYSLVVILPSLAVGTRRLHDTGRNGWWQLIVVVPLLGALVLIFFYVQDSKLGQNDYGPNPKGDIAGTVEERLQHLESLKNNGLVTDAEFLQKKRNIQEPSNLASEGSKRALWLAGLVGIGLVSLVALYVFLFGTFTSGGIKVKAGLRPPESGTPILARDPGTNSPAPLVANATTRPSKIVFLAAGDLYSANPDGSGAQNVTSQARAAGLKGSISVPSLSYDGTRIAFVTNDRGPGDVFLINVDGSGLTNVTNSPALYFSAAWSPDGRQLAVSAIRDGSVPGIAVVNADGSGFKRLTNESVGDAQNPAWSPDGRRIAFGTRNYYTGLGQPGIHVINADGSGLQRLTSHGNTNRGDDNPTWSPDGRRIAFSDFGTSSEAGGIAIINSDGSGLFRLTSARESYPNWSPDGKQLLYVKGPTIYIANSDGSNPKGITFNQAVFISGVDWR